VGLGQIENVDGRIEAKRSELQTKRAELKAVENLKDKDLLVWRKAYNKETDQKVEEMVQLWGENRKTRGDA
jgi:flagellar biosynthesis chaperone FliJ